MKIRKGSTRIVFIFENIVIKIAINFWGFRQNKNETRIYKQMNYDRRLAKIIYGDKLGLLVIMEKVIPVEVAEYNYHESLNKLQLSICEWAEKNIYDTIDYQRSLGLRKGGTFCIFDYGEDRSISLRAHKKYHRREKRRQRKHKNDKK